MCRTSAVVAQGAALLRLVGGIDGLGEQAADIPGRAGAAVATAAAADETERQSAARGQHCPAARNPELASP
jgi:hypothetical protein